MKRLSIYCILVASFAALSACNLPRVQPGQVTPPSGITTTPGTGIIPSPTGTASAGSVATPPPVITPSPGPTITVPAAVTPPAGMINLELLKNFSYWIADFNTQVQLTNGEYSDGQIYSRLVEPAALGDLNGDGATDAAVVLTADPSGSGTFYYLTAVIDQGGTPTQAGVAYIGDRQVINRLEINGGRIVMDYLTQSLRDPLCCPSEHRLRSYILENTTLRLASEQILDSAAAQATPLPNAILIDQPAEIDPLTNPLQVRGRVSQVPPEKKLEYYVTDFNAILLAQGEVILEGDPGGPGTFSFELSLDAGSPGLIQLELVDSANGILRGRSTVSLVAQ